MFKKTCPYCDQLIDADKLRKVPWTEKLRWYQITPAPRTACPYCGGFVVSTLANSPVAILVFGIPLLLVIFSISSSGVKEALETLPGGVVFLVVIIIPFWLWFINHAKLNKDIS